MKVLLSVSVLFVTLLSNNVQAQRGTVRKSLDLLGPRFLKGGGGMSKKGSSSGHGYGSSYSYADDECEICSKENKNRPVILTMKYIGGQGVISKYQDGEKATCRDQIFPMETTIVAYDVAYPVQSGDVITIGEDGFKMDAETDFTFSGSSIECYIHTSCSQPLVTGDQIGPFLLLEGNDCTYPLCGDGQLDPGETCEPVGSIMEGTGFQCRDDCTYCGDGLLNGDEVCDEGDMMPSSTCRDCTIPSCGDGFRDEGETCDPPGNAIVDGVVVECRNDCTYCGDGIKNPGEECDEGDRMPTSQCRDCGIPRCGDKYKDPGETCEPPGSFPSDGVGECRDDCTYCGDGIKNGYEECDDGTSMPSQKCRDCLIPRCGDDNLDQGETCEPPGKWMGGMSGECRNDCTYCGDGIKNGDEECDHGDDMPSLLCRDCRTPYCGDKIKDENETCDPPGSEEGRCRDDCFFCGDGVVNGNEECDEGSSMPTSSCNDCEVPAVIQSRCGDGITDENETCDPPGNAIIGGVVVECRNDCTYCGDGIKNADEDCDEGNKMPSPSCKDCRIPYCGDRNIDENESCDPPGSFVVGGVGACRNDCTFCGDGIRNGYEECDEGTSMPTQSCRDCVIPRCGDDILDQGETCEPPGKWMGGMSGECRTDCTYCGDGIKNGDEECDHGHGMPSLTCKHCRVPSCGDHTVDENETCDPPGSRGGKCRNDCSYCGDGRVNGDEQCDEGSLMPSLTCKECRRPHCGDDHTDENETCDPPGSMSGKCRNDCFYCGDGLVNGDEECDAGINMPSPQCKNCRIPRCGDRNVDENETCDPPGTMDGECRNDCFYCGDGVVNGDEECDEGDSMPSPTCDACKKCVCEATGSYDPTTGSVTLQFDFCGEAQPAEDDFIAIYPCETTSLMVADQRWFDDICSTQLKSISNCEQYLLNLGYEKGKVYPIQSGTWMSFTCGSPGDDDCQNKNNHNTVWPSNNIVTIDPDNYWKARWAFPFQGPTLEEGCYKTLVHRDISQAISAPPYPSVCKDWYESPSFIVSKPACTSC